MNKKLFVAYKGIDKKSVVKEGSVVMVYEKPVSSIDDIREISDRICMHEEFDEIAITNWKRMEDAE